MLLQKLPVQFSYQGAPLFLLPFPAFYPSVEQKEYDKGNRVIEKDH